MEGKGTNPNVHKTYRLLLKKRLYIRCMKIYPDLFKGKLEMLELKSKGKDPKTYEDVVPFIWNSSIEGDELCVEVLKQLKQEGQSVGGSGLASEGIKLQLK